MKLGETWLLHDVLQVHADGSLTLANTNRMGVTKHQVLVSKRDCTNQRLALCVMTVTGIDHTNRSRRTTYEQPLADITFTLPHRVYSEIKDQAMRQLAETHGDEFLQTVVVDFYHVQEHPIPQFLQCQR